MTTIDKAREMEEQAKENVKYLAYYLGANAEGEGKTGTLVGVTNWAAYIGTKNSYQSVTPHKVVLYLRPLSTMTVAELRVMTGQFFAEKYAQILIKDISASIYKFHEFISHFGEQDTIAWLLEKHFDVFGLIAKGIAKETKGS